MSVRLKEKLGRRRTQGNLRQLCLVPKLTDFSSNDYLGLARSSVLASMINLEVAHQSNGHHGFGSTGSRLLTGNSLYAQELEETIAAFHGYEAGLLFNCGYMANVGLLSAVLEDQDTVFFDARIHASAHDGIRLSRAAAFSFRHNDMEHLEKRLKNVPVQGDRWICVESLYSTNGSKAPLREICRLARQYEAKVIVDEAHAVGICGPFGSGLVAELNLTDEVFAQVVTFSKALGVHGAIVLGSNVLKQTLLNFAHSMMYTTALPFQLMAGIKCVYSLLPQLNAERKHLDHLVNVFRECGFHRSETHIQPFPISGNEKIKRAAQNLLMEGFDVRPLLSPTVQRGHEILRINLHTFNNEEEVKTLLYQLKLNEGIK